MVLKPELEALLQAARLEAFAPVLAELGVEAAADLEFVQDADFENKEHLTTLQKRRFNDWKAKTLDELSKPTSLTSDTQQTLEVATSKESQGGASSSKRLSHSTKLATCGPEALRPAGFERRDPALDVDFNKIFNDPNLSPDDAKILFHDLCKKHHPDKGGNAEVFASINKAYNNAVDPLDAYLEKVTGPPPPTPPPPTTEKKEEGYKATGGAPPPPEATPESVGSADATTTMQSETNTASLESRRSFRESVGCLLPSAFLRKSASEPSSLNADA